MSDVNYMDWSKTTVDDLSKQENDNFELSKKLLGQDDLPFLERFRKAYHSSNLSVPDAKSLQVRFYYDSVKFLDFAIVTLMRGHVTEAMFELRRSIETVAYAFKMQDPEVAKIWLEKKFYDDEFRKAFSNKWKGMGSLGQLKSFWETGTEVGGHARIQSQLYRHDILQNHQTVHGYFDFNRDNPSYLIKKWFHYILTANVFILETYHEIFDEYLSKEWWDDVLKLMGEYNQYKFNKLKAWLDANTPYKPKDSGIIIPKPGDVIKFILGEN